MKKNLLLLSISLFLLFVYFSYLVHKGNFNQFDFNTTVRIQNHVNHRFDLPFSLLTLLASVEVSGLVWLGFLIYFLIKKYFLVSLFLFSFWISQVFEVYGKLFVVHPGPPFMFYRGVSAIVFPSSYIQTQYSYPSGHATRSTFLISFLIIYFTFFLKKKHALVLNVGLIVLLLAVYISRVYLGEHWTTDVIGGALLGGSLGLFSSLMLPIRKLKNSAFETH